jgi:carbonic anhydrase
MFFARFKTIIPFLTSAVILQNSIQAANSTSTSPTPIKALSMIMEGNNHFVKGEMQHLSYVAEAKDKLLEKQTPFAVIVGCSDSRVPPEVIFDRGLGELFVVRVAGNVLGPIEIGSVEFAVEVLKSPLVMVLGHQNCGAVKASLQGSEHVPDFLEAIYPLIKDALANCETIGASSLVNAIHCNVKKGVGTLKNSSIIAPLIEQKKVKVVGAYFDFDSGKVQLISD